ncbi:hypothetical protein [Streptomyces tsukubensis]|uniref:hypothetical protein n=1 Tax=Streptomyces tsukubensis TaxID=83656 RepID=UPI00344DEA45
MTASLRLPDCARTLLRQGGHPADVPDDPRLLHGGWLPALTAQLLYLAATPAPGTHAHQSFTTPGHTHLLLQHPGARGCFAYLRLHAPGTPEPQAAADKTVTLTLTGSHTLEGYRHETDVRDDRPWLLRTFTPEAVYACHPGNLDPHHHSRRSAARPLPNAAHPAGNGAHRGLLPPAARRGARTPGRGWGARADHGVER